MVEKKEELVEKHRCKKCGSLFGYLRIKDEEWQCRTCGYVDKKGVQK